MKERMFQELTLRSDLKRRNLILGHSSLLTTDIQVWVQEERHRNNHSMLLNQNSALQIKSLPLSCPQTVIPTVWNYFKAKCFFFEVIKLLVM